MKSALVLLLNLLCLQAFASNSGVTYQGRILKPDGSPLSGQFTQFKLQVRTPDSQNCLMYEEVQSQDLRNSNGSFSLTINDGTGSRIDTTGLTLDRIFANRGTFTLDPTNCSSGAGTYLPNASDGRDLVVLFKDETMTSWEPIPAAKINFVPFAFETKQIAGFTADSILRVVNGSGDPLTGLAPLSNAQYTEFLALVNGTSTAFTKSGQLGGVSLPTMSTGEVLGWNGSAWVSQPAVAGANSVTTSMIQNNAVDSTKIATGAVGTTQIASNVSINTSGTVASAITTTRDFKIYAASPSTFNIDMQAPALAASYSLVWPLNDGGAGEVLTTDGSGVLSWAPAAASSQWTSQAPGINYMGGLVGIGTTSPTAKLEVVGGDAAINTLTVGLGGGAVANNSAFGVSSLSANTTGGNNTALGFEALKSNTTNSYLTAVGQGALRASNGTTTGSVAVGSGALYNNTTGNGNVAVGTFAVITSTTGNQNTGLGHRALQNATTASLNSSVGYQSLQGVTTGDGNTGIGHFAGANITTGANNIILGRVNAPSPTSSNQLNIGNIIFGTGIDGTGSTLSTGNVGIGTTSPAAKLDVNGTVNATAFTLNGTPLSAGGPSQSGTAGFVFNSNSDSTSSDGGFSFQSGGANLVNISNAGNVGVGTSVPTNKLDVVGGATIGYNGTVAAPANGLLVGGALGIGNSFFSNSSATVPQADLHISNASGTSTFMMGRTSSWQMKMQTNGSGFLTVDGGNNTFGELHKAQDGGFTVDLRTAPAVFDLKANGANVMRVNYSGNVGIGTTSPSRMLDVAGDASINSLRVGLGAGQIASNVVLGSGALNSNTTGGSNIAIGLDAMKSTTTSYGKIAIGSYALQNAGDRSIAIGTYAGTNSTGQDSIFIGDSAGFGNGDHDTIVGSRAANNISYNGSSNVMIGASAGSGMTTGNQNVLLGMGSGTNLTTGANNIVIGTNAPAYSATANNKLNIGNTIYGDTAAGNVGIGTTAPATKLDVQGIIRSVGAGGTTYSNASAAVDWSNGNNQIMTSACTTSTFTNMADGATYNLLVTDTTATTCTFSQAGLTFTYAPQNAARESGKMSLYSFTRFANYVVVGWTPLN